MDVRNCRRCGKIFQYVAGKPICPNCRQKEEDDFEKVRSYLYDYQGATLMEVAQATGVSAAMIQQFLREDRLMIPKDSPITIGCENCGTGIKSGRFCSACTAQLGSEMRMAVKSGERGSVQAEGAEKGRMHFLNKNKTTSS